MALQQDTGALKMNSKDISLLVLSIIVWVYLVAGGIGQAVLAVDNEIWMDQSGATANIDLE